MFDPTILGMTSPAQVQDPEFMRAMILRVESEILAGRNSGKNADGTPSTPKVSPIIIAAVADTANAASVKSGAKSVPTLDVSALDGSADAANVAYLQAAIVAAETLLASAQNAQDYYIGKITRASGAAEDSGTDDLSVLRANAMEAVDGASMFGNPLSKIFAGTDGDKAKDGFPVRFLGEKGFTLPKATGGKGSRVKTAAKAVPTQHLIFAVNGKVIESSDLNDVARALWTRGNVLTGTALLAKIGKEMSKDGKASINGHVLTWTRPSGPIHAKAVAE